MFNYLGKEVLIDIKYVKNRRVLECDAFQESEACRAGACVWRATEAGEITEAFRFLISSSVKWECWLVLNDTCCHKEQNQGCSCASRGLCWNTLLRGGGAPQGRLAPFAKPFAHLSAKSWGAVTHLQEGAVCASSHRIKYVMTLLFSQGLLLFPNECLSLPPVESVELDHYTWTQPEWLREETKDKDSPHFEAGRSPNPNTLILQKRSPRLRVTPLTLKKKKKSLIT